MNEKILQRLRYLDACAVSDAMDRLGMESRYAGGLPQRSSSRKVFGQVVTFKLAPAGSVPRTPGPLRHLGTTAIEQAEPGNVIVVEQRTGIDAGCWGGILSLAATLKGVSGVIADGPVRDIDEARTYDLPIFSRSVTARTARGRVEEVSVNEPVCIDGITVQASDWVIADGSGVVFIPADRALEVVEAAERIAAREAAMAKDLLAGRPVPQVMGKDYEHMLRPESA